MYRRIKKDLDSLYAESKSREFTIDQHIGRCLYEYEQIIDPEEERNIESFFFYLAVLKQLQSLKTENSISSKAIQVVSDKDTYDAILKNNDISEEELKLIVQDYEDVLS